MELETILKIPRNGYSIKYCLYYQNLGAKKRVKRYRHLRDVEKRKIK